VCKNRGRANVFFIAFFHLLLYSRAMRKLLLVAWALLLLADGAQAQAVAKKKLLLLWQGPDGHPPQTHEYEAGQKILQKLLANVPGVEAELVRADEPWREGPRLLDGADGAVLFLSEGANWSQHDPERAAAFLRLAKRGGGIAVIHWAMGTREAKNIAGFLELAGGCHGGPDRKYQVLATGVHIADPKHPVTRGLRDFKARDEFYYHLKFVMADTALTPLLQADIDGRRETVAWAWQRPDGGRSFGFSGLHFHENWGVPEYRRLVGQGVVWSMRGAIPMSGLKMP
jgi:type 1 glutamine amidotransferase